MNAEKAVLGRRLTEETIAEAAAAAYPAAKPLDNTDYAMAWRKEMARYYVAGVLRELGGLPQPTARPSRANGISALQVLPESAS